jgi:glycosyltransferase involved in cell wall biosynthesis
MKLLYYAPASYGGLFNYAQEQAHALGELGVEVTVLCSPRFEKRPHDRYALLPKLTDSRIPPGGSKLVRSLRFLRVLLRNKAVLRKEIVSGGYDRVMLVSYAEYFAPFWARQFLRLSRNGVRFGAVVQEPVRHFQVGPDWWHRWSIGSAYSFLSYAFEHDDVALETYRPMPDLKTYLVPMGPHEFPDATAARAETRRKLDIPDTAVVLLSFGHIRDNKNLDLVIRALKEIPEAHLVVAGARSATSQRPASFYMDLAKTLGVSARCTWVVDYVTEEEAANLFTACDLVLLTYNSSFRSASGVLNVAARYRKPCIASAGQGSLQTVVRKHHLGIWAEPDSPDALAQAIREWIARPPEPDWERYERENSWHRNAQVVAEAFGFHPAADAPGNGQGR